MKPINEKKSRLRKSIRNLKNVLMMILMLHSGLLLSDAVYGNNVRIEGEPVVQLNSTSDSLSLTFTLSWDNSWRDDFNWDAVWLFVKYKREGRQDAWSHLCLGGSQVGTANLEIDPGNTGSQIVGAFVYPKHKGTFHITGEQVKLQAPLNGLSAVDITEGKIYFAVTGIEMVLIPYGAYYLGDDFSNQTFQCNPYYEVIPESSDIIDLNSGYTITASYEYYSAKNAADHQNSSIYSSSATWYTYSSSPAWWKIDFGSPRTVRFFGASGASNYYPSYIPTSTWYLEGSNDNVNWTVLQVVNKWWAPTTSYPVQNSIRVSHPGAYRYYRVNIPVHSDVMVQNIAMSEDELYTDTLCFIDSEDQYVVRVGKADLSLPAAYPKGYKGFYVMKYELSQEQYVNFLNMLSYAQQKSRIGNNLDNLERGDYVFADPAQPSCRNGIAVFSNKGTSQPVVFGNNLNPAEPFFAEDDGQTLACNYMTGADMLAYLDWSGLRPLSELEYEKMCRTPNRVTPGEYAWNSTVVHSLGGQSGLSSSTVGTENEVPVGLSTNVNSGAPSFGPVRCGSFGSSTSTQQESGSSFYGVMELSGNLGEMYYSVTGGSALNTSSLANEYHGDGVIDNKGDYNVGSYWNRSSDASAFLVRGGSFASGDSLLRVSDRSIVKGYDNTERDSTVTFRGGRSIGKSIDPGEISCDATCPGLVTVNSVRDAVADCDLSYLWYVKRPGASDYELIPGETGCKLTDYEVMSSGTSSTMFYSFQRKVVALTGEAAHQVKVELPNTAFSLDVNETGLDVCDISETPVIATSKGGGGTFSWTYQNNVLTEGISSANNKSTYIPKRLHFGQNVKDGGVFPVECTYLINGCSEKLTIEVTVAANNIECPSTVMDKEGNVYPVVKINCQCWMGKNMNIGSFRTTGSTGRWLYTKAGIQKWCKDNVASNCNVYGGLYEWWEAVCGGKCDHLTEAQAENVAVANETDLLVYGAKPATVPGKIQGICPDGWHIPTVQEVKIVVTLSDISNLVIPVGGNCWSYRDQSFGYSQTGFWTSQSYGAGCAHMAWTMTPNSPGTLQIGGYGSSFAGYTNFYDYGHYVRCIKD